MTSRVEFVEKLKEKLDNWNADIDRFESELSTLGGEMKQEVETQISKLREHRDEMRTKMGQIHEVSEEAWEEMSGGLEEAWQALKEGFQKAKERAKKD